MGITAYRKIEGVEVTLSDSTNHVFPKHSHDEFYLGANISGREKIWLDGKRSEASIDEITVYNPGQVQAATPTPYDWVYYSFYIQPEMMAELTGLPADEEFKKSVFAAPDIAALIARTGAFCLIGHHGENEMLEKLSTLLCALVKRTGSRTKFCVHDKDALLAERIALRLREDLYEPPSLKALSAEFGLTSVQLVRVFNAHFGLPPFAWLKGEKLKIARQLILRGLPLADIAAGLGFSDQPHFTHSFRDMFGVTPGQMFRLAKA
ncbi:helix-turn-helix transcriptional regulator [Dryocola sp. LX212]|jgi:AraC-like DNA-binding protein